MLLQFEEGIGKQFGVDHADRQTDGQELVNVTGGNGLVTGNPRTQSDVRKLRGSDCPIDLRGACRLKIVAPQLPPLLLSFSFTPSGKNPPDLTDVGVR